MIEENKKGGSLGACGYLAVPEHGSKSGSAGGHQGGLKRVVGIN